MSPEAKEIAKAGLRAVGAQDGYIAELEKLEKLVREYLDEREAPVPDFVLRQSLRLRMRAIVGNK